jgi:hypothetical protein
MAVIAVCVATMTSLETAQTVGAYSLQGTPQSQSGLNFGSLLSPIQNFLNSIGSVGKGAIPQLNLSAPQTQFLTTSAQNVFQQFDDWFYGVAGFRISGFLVFILNILLWVLGIAESIVRWLLGFLR